MKKNSIAFCMLGIMAIFMSCATTQKKADNIDRLQFPIYVTKGEVTITASGCIYTKGLFYQRSIKSDGILPDGYGEFDNDKIEQKTVDTTVTKRKGNCFNTACRLTRS